METEFRNDFTQFLDEYRIDEYKNLEYPYNEMMTTYLWYDDFKRDFSKGENIKHIAFRIPGATRGHIAVDRDYKITDIVFYADTCFNTRKNGVECYKPEVVYEATIKFRDTILSKDGFVGDEYFHGKA